ncbi:hypothetical protein GGR54DRAFT_254314 [Hypoxylon sp. NC1633]|nr:hypothetical protein GGR54DRAFT_254314 [Hypoxylon sp. NC1633]
MSVGRYDGSLDKARRRMGRDIGEMCQIGNMDNEAKRQARLGLAWLGLCCVVLYCVPYLGMQAWTVSMLGCAVYRCSCRWNGMEWAQKRGRELVYHISCSIGTYGRFSAVVLAAAAAAAATYLLLLYYRLSDFVIKCPAFWVWSVSCYVWGLGVGCELLLSICCCFDAWLLVRFRGICVLRRGVVKVIAIPWYSSLGPRSYLGTSTEGQSLVLFSYFTLSLVS